MILPNDITATQHENIEKTNIHFYPLNSSIFTFYNLTVLEGEFVMKLLLPTVGVLLCSCVWFAGCGSSGGGSEEVYEDDSSHNDSYHNDSYQDDFYEDDSYEDDSYEDDSYEDDSYEDDSYQDDSYEDDSYEDDSYQDDSYQDDSYQDDSYQDDSYNDSSYEVDNGVEPGDPCEIFCEYIVVSCPEPIDSCTYSCEEADQAPDDTAIECAEASTDCVSTGPCWAMLWPTR